MSRSKVAMLLALGTLVALSACAENDADDAYRNGRRYSYAQPAPTTPHFTYEEHSRSYPPGTTFQRAPEFVSPEAYPPGHLGPSYSSPLQDHD